MIFYFSEGTTYYYGTRLKYIAVQVNTTINDAEVGYIKGIPLRDKWEEVISREVPIIISDMQYVMPFYHICLVPSPLLSFKFFVIIIVYIDDVMLFPFVFQIAKLEPELQGGWQSTPRGIRWNLWHWIKVQEVSMNENYFKPNIINQNT